MEQVRFKLSQSNYLKYLPWLVCGIAAVFYLYAYLLRVEPSVMTREVMSYYHLNARTFGNLSAFYYYIYAPMQLLVGLLLDRYGPRYLLSIAVLLCSIGAYLFASSHLLWVAETGRFLIGLGSAFTFVGVLKLAIIWLPAHRFAFISGLAVSLGMVGAISGDIILTHLASFDGWKLACYIVAAFGLLLTVLVYLIVRDKKEISVDNLPLPVLSFKDVCLGCWALLKKPQIWVNGLTGCLLYLPMSAFAESWEIPYFSQTANFSHQNAAFAASIVFFGWAVGAPLLGWFSDTIRQRRLPLTIGAAVSVILFSYILYVPHTETYDVYLILFLFGLASSAQVIVFPICREISPPHLAGTAISLTNMIIMLSGVSVWLIGVLLERQWHGNLLAGLHHYTLGNYQVALLVVPIGLMLAVFLTFFLNETFCKQMR